MTSSIPVCRCGREQRLLDGELAAAIGIAGKRRVGAAKRGSRRGRVTHRPDRAEMDEPPHARAGRGARQCRGRLGLFLRGRIRDRAVGPIGEMNDASRSRRDARTSRFPG